MLKTILENQTLRDVFVLNSMVGPNIIHIEYYQITSYTYIKSWKMRMLILCVCRRDYDILFCIRKID